MAWTRVFVATKPFVVLLLLLVVASCDGTQPSDRMDRARQFLEHGRPQGAIVELKKVLQENPRDGQARWLLGTAYLRLGRWSDAEKELTRALDLGGDPAEITLALGRIWLRQGEFQKVLSGLKDEPDWPKTSQVEALVLRGEAQIELGEPEGAKQSYMSALSIDPNHAEAAVGLVRIAVRRGDAKDIRASLDRALRVAPRHPSLLGLTGALAFEAGDYRAAAAAYRAQLGAAPDRITARLGLAQSLLALGEDDAVGLEIDKILAHTPNHPTALYLRAILNHRKGDFTAARADSLRALEGMPNHEPSMAIAASANYALGRWREAHWYADTILRRTPDHETARQILEAAGRAMAAADEATTPVPRGPIEDDLALFSIRAEIVEAKAGPGEASEAEQEGLNALLQGRETEAIAPLDRALSLRPDGQAVLRLALAHHRTGADVRARIVMEQWLDRQFHDTEVRRVLARLYLRDHAWDRALLHLRVLVEADPKDSEATNNLAWILLRQGELDEALVLAERAIALAPDDPRVMDTYALALLKTGDAGRALPLLRRAAASDIGPPEVRLHLAEALMRNGDRDEARSVLQGILGSVDAIEAHRPAEILLERMGQ